MAAKRRAAQDLRVKDLQPNAWAGFWASQVLNMLAALICHNRSEGSARPGLHGSIHRCRRDAGVPSEKRVLACPRSTLSYRGPLRRQWRRPEIGL